MPPYEDEQTRRLREELGWLAAGHDALTSAFPIQEGIEGALGELGSMSEEERAEAGLLGTLYRMGRAGAAGLQRPFQRAAGQATPYLFGRSATTAAPPQRKAAAPPPAQPAPPRTMEDALAAGGHSGAEGQAAALSMTEDRPQKNVIVSRRLPDGRIVFETAPAGPSTPTGPDVYSGPGLGVEEWKARALATQRPSSGNGVNPSGARPSSFAVRPGPGGFSPGRQADDVLRDAGTDLVGLTETQILRESPLVQEMMREAQANEFARRQQQAGLGDLDLRRRMLAAQTGLAEEQLKRVQDPAIGAREDLALFNEFKRQLGPDVQLRVQSKLQAAVAALTAEAGGQPPDPALVAALEKQLIEQEGGALFASRAQQRQLLDPRFTYRQF